MERTTIRKAAPYQPPVMITHGHSREKLYKVWISMRQRCRNPNNRDYFRYGGRGISVCQEWDDYAVFRAWAHENGYKEGLDLDRRNNDEGYSPENCRFVTHQQNLLNTHRKIVVDVDGEEMSLRMLSDKTGIAYNVLWGRYRRGRRGRALLDFNYKH